MIILFSLLALAVVQGIAEFLPISSSGHLVVFHHLLGMKAVNGLWLDILLHAGSLFALIVFYFTTLIGFLKRESWPLLLKVGVATVPAGIAGLTIKKLGLDESFLFSHPAVVAFGWLITATLLRLTAKEKLLPQGEPKKLRDITWRQAIVTGLAQMFAILPGISRSGSTIAAGILSGVERGSAATFSFLLAIPVIGGASLLEIKKICSDGLPPDAPSPAHLIIVTAVAAAVSFGALSLINKIVKKGWISFFSWYLYAAGLLTLGWSILKTTGKF